MGVAGFGDRTMADAIARGMLARHEPQPRREGAHGAEPGGRARFHTSANAVMVSMPFMHLSASTRPRQRSFCACWDILFSIAFFCASIWRTSDM